MIKTADGVLWARLPDPPFPGAPWIGCHKHDVTDGKLDLGVGGYLIIPTERECCLLDALEDAIEKTK